MPPCVPQNRAYFNISFSSHPTNVFSQPQRPIRALHIQGDENIAPPSKQQLHQRHKSTGALSTMLGVGGLKGAAKRTAFGDVSNTAKSFNNIQEDKFTDGKNNAHEAPQKTAQILDKPSGFLRPAQRPLTVAGLKGLLGNNATVNPSTSKAPLTAPLAETSQVAKSSRTFLKRATTIYKDNAATNSDQSSQVATHNAAPIPPVHQSLGPRQHKSQPQLKADQPVLRRTQSKHLGSSIEESRQEYVPAQLSKEGPIDEHVKEVVKEALSVASASNTDVDNAAADREAVLMAAQIKEDKAAAERELPLLPLVSEPEEYWEEEEEEEVYDEQGYTTAHSYRSRGDNTTGGATTVLFPKITSKVKKELAIAKDLVEAARTPEEIEDEAWDTSMVAEYGEEIFSYMRELEV
jgi:G2/mitotic-specific cyclin 3/4